MRVLVYGGGLLLLGLLAWAVLDALRRHSFAMDDRCQQRALSCGVLASFVVPLLTLALVSAFFLLGRLWYLRRRCLRAARSRPQDVVPTAGSIIGDVVGRDELCRVMIADLRDARTRRPHVVVGGIGTGKTALLVRLTKLLAHQRAVPVAIGLRDAQKSLNFRELARKRFIADLESDILSDVEGEKVWRQLLKEGRIVVLADGLEEALAGPGNVTERDNIIRLAIRQANKDQLPLIIASRPHNPLRGTEAALVELEPLSEEAALDYIQRGDPIEDEQRIDWIVETADVAETPLYLQIARQLRRLGLLMYVSANPDNEQLDTRSVDRADLRLGLLKTWEQALVNGHFPPGVALSRDDRLTTIDQLSVLACIGMRHDSLQVELEEFETLVDRHKPGQSVPIIEKAGQRFIASRHSFDIRLAATWGTQLQLVEAQENAVRFPHSILQAYLGSRLIGYAMADRRFQEDAFEKAGREMLIALVMHSRASRRQRGLAGPDRATSVLAGPNRDAPHPPGADPVALDPAGLDRSAAKPTGSDPESGIISAGTDTDGSCFEIDPVALRALLREAAGRRTDAKALDLYATALEIDSADPAPEHEAIAAEIAAKWEKLAERDPRTLEHAKFNLVRRFGESARTISQRCRGTKPRANRKTSPRTGPDAGPGASARSACDNKPAYRELFEIGCCEPSYPVRLAAAQEIGAGGDDALAELADVLEPPSAPRDQTQDMAKGRANATEGERRQSNAGYQSEQTNEDEEEKTQRRKIMRAWLVPLLVGSATGATSFETGRGLLERWLDFVYAQNQPLGRGRTGLSIEVALAQGFKYAANRRRGHPQARDDARAYLAEQAKEMLGTCNFWFSRLTLLHALTLWHLHDGANRQRDHRRDLNYKTLVAHWCGMDSQRRRDSRSEHPFVAEACHLAVRALETGQPERYMWIDESGVVSRVGSRPAKPQSRRKHNLWIPPSTGWTALSPHAQQLVADVLLLLNLAERGRAADRDKGLQSTNRNYLPSCIAEDRSPLDPSRPLGTAGDFEAGSNCKVGCRFGLCPYPARGAQYYRQELGEAFCRRQQRLLTPRLFRARAAPWQEMSAARLRQFWRDLGQPVPSSELEYNNSGKPRSRDVQR